MTREEAVKQLTINRPSKYTELREAIDMAIEALKPKPMQKFDNVKQHIDRLAGDYKCWDERLSHEEALELSRMLEQQPCEDLCKTCDTKGCIFQFGIKRKKCDFYTPKKRGMSDKQIRTVIGVLTCEDAISRAYIEPFVEELENICINGDEHVLDILSNIKNAPPVTPKQKVGHWIYDKAIENWRCSECNETPRTMGYVGTSDFMAEHFRFCNHCGIKMKVSENDW